MELYTSEEEQIAALKRWWRDNGRSAIIGIVLGIAAVIGWNVWQTHKATQALQASALYQELLTAVESDQDDSARKLIERLKDLYGSTAYAAYANLFLAKLNAESGDFPGAREALNDTIKRTEDDNVKHVARIRLLQLMLADGEAEAALQMLAELDLEKAGQFEANYQELSGDSYAALNRPGEARAAYQRAVARGNRSGFLQLKMDDLASPPIQESTD